MVSAIQCSIKKWALRLLIRHLFGPTKLTPLAPVYTSLTAAAAAAQSERYRQIVAAYLRAVPTAQRGGITVWGMWDAQSWFAQDPDWPLLFDNNFQAKPALQGFANGLTGQ